MYNYKMLWQKKIVFEQYCVFAKIPWNQVINNFCETDTVSINICQKSIYSDYYNHTWTSRWLRNGEVVFKKKKKKKIATLWSRWWSNKHSWNDFPEFFSKRQIMSWLWVKCVGELLSTLPFLASKRYFSTIYVRKYFF